eukprot:1138644-Pelagomonas_calceolata.AAC.6
MVTRALELAPLLALVVLWQAAILAGCLYHSWLMPSAPPKAVHFRLSWQAVRKPVWQGTMDQHPNISGRLSSSTRASFGPVKKAEGDLRRPDRNLLRCMHRCWARVKEVVAGQSSTPLGINHHPIESSAKWQQQQDGNNQVGKTGVKHTLNAATHFHAYRFGGTAHSMEFFFPICSCEDESIDELAAYMGVGEQMWQGSHALAMVSLGQADNPGVRPGGGEVNMATHFMILNFIHLLVVMYMLHVHPAASFAGQYFYYTF